MMSLRIARQLLWANRWLWGLLLLWPWAMAAILMVSTDGHPTLEDVEAACQQQGIYGLALVAFAGGSLLGNEQRSRRIAMVLARAVSRRQYLGALWLTAFMPLLVYAFDVALTGMLLHALPSVLGQNIAALVLLGVTTASLAVLASIVLPGVVAGVLSLAALSLLLVLQPGWQIALTRLLQIVVAGPMTERITLIFGAGLLETVLLAGALFELAVRIFQRRDLRLKSE